MSVATAWLLAQELETTPDFWMDRQASYDLARPPPERPAHSFFRTVR